MAEDQGLVISWQGEEKNRIGDLVATIEVDQDSMAGFDTRIVEAFENIDPDAVEKLSELSEAINEIVAAGVQVSLAVYAGIAPVMEQAQNAMEEFANSLRKQFEPVFQWVNDYWETTISIYEMCYDCEKAYRKYVHRLNWKRPHRKLSWRRLNRQQRRDAIAWYLAEYGPFAL